MSSSAGLSPNNPTKYVGPHVYLNTVVMRNRSPTGADYRQPETGKLYPIDCYWIVGKDPTTGVEGDLWYLSKIVANVGYWLMLSNGGSGPLLNITVPLGVSPIVPDGTGTMHFTSSGGTIAITGSTANPNNHTINFDLSGGATPAIETFTVQAATAPGLTTVTPDGSGNVSINGAAVANHSVVLETRSRALHVYNVEIQYAASAAATDATKSGVAHFDSTAFTVDANGFVQLAGGAGPAVDSINVDAHTAPGTDPVVPTAGGLITVTGAQVATGIIGANVIRTDSLAANTYTIEIQQTAATAAKDTTKNGVAHFKSTDFTVDEGFVALANPVNPPPNSVVNFVDDFLGRGSVAANELHEWYKEKMSLFGPAGVASVAEAGHPGIAWNQDTGDEAVIAMATGYVASSGLTNSSQIILGGGSVAANWVFKVTTAVTFTLFVGLGVHTLTGGGGPVDPPDGVYLRYNTGVNGGNWQLQTIDSTASTTTVNTAVAFTTGWHNAGVTVNAAGTLAEYFLDGVSLGTIATNIPKTVQIGGLIKAQGTVADSTFLVDLFYMTINLTTPR